jgi:hypothetical protein
MEWLTNLVRVLVILFILAFLITAGYVIWYIVKNGISNIAGIEDDLKTLISEAENKASIIQNAIVNEYKNIKGTLVGAYETVKDKLVETANTIKRETDNTITIVKREGDKVVSDIENVYNDVINKVTGKSKEAINTINDTSMDIIEKIKTTATQSSEQIKSNYIIVTNSIVGASREVTNESESFINKIKSDVLRAYDTIESESTKAYKTVEAKTNEAINEIKTFSETSATMIEGRTNQAINEIKTFSETSATMIEGKTKETVTTIEAKTKEIVSTIKTEGDNTINKIRNEVTTLLEKIERETVGLVNQIASEIEKGTKAGFQDYTVYNEGFQSTTDTIPLDQSLFLDVQPLSIKDTGFLGPYPRGRYKEDVATANVLKAGCRFLTLQIDYTDSKMDLSLFEAPDVPTLLVRGPDSVLLSKNSGDIKDVVSTIVNVGFNPIAPNNTLPIIIYLHIVRAPSVVNKPEVYLDFLSSIADSLQPIAPYHLGLTPIGNFTRQKMSEELLTTPLNQLEGKIIIMSNADTSLFRRTSVNKTKYAPSKDLDFWVNMRVYLDTADDLNGITQLADTSVAPSAVLVDLKRVLALSTINKEAFAMKGKQRFVIAMGERTANPSPEQVAMALNRLGVNVIPIDIFTPDDRDILLLTNEYRNKTFQQKPANLQYIS